LFDLVKSDGSNEKILYILDWYVSPGMIDSGIGDQLMKIADDVSTSNGCSVLFNVLMPEDFADMDKLKNANSNRGFEIRETEKMVMAVKK
jgi:hypothetical protein